MDQRMNTLKGIMPLDIFALNPFVEDMFEWKKGKSRQLQQL
jgi:hypothetical protein